MEFNLEEICEELDSSYTFRADIFEGSQRTQLYISHPLDCNHPTKRKFFSILEMKVIFTKYFNCPAPDGLLSFQKERYEPFNETNYVVYIYDEKKETSKRFVAYEDKNLIREKIYGKIEPLESRDSTIRPEDYMAL